MTSPRDVAGAAWLLDPAGFGAHVTQGHYLIPTWIDYVSRITAEEFAKGGARLLISAPPQFGKSQLFAGIVPPWCLERDPSNKAIVASYGSELAARSVRYGRDLVHENESRLRIRMGKSSEEYWESLPGDGRTPGYVRAVGVGSGTTGFGIDTGVIDDPYSGPDQAFSEAYRAKVEEWFWSVFMTRLSKRANVVGIMCVTADTPVLMGNGEWKPVVDVRVGDMVKTHEDGRLTNRRVAAFLPQGAADVYEVRTGNHRVRATGNHPFLTRRGWVRADNLTTDDEVVAIGTVRGGRAPSDVSEEDAWALGFMFGDGWITRHPNALGSMRWATCVARSVYPELNDRIVAWITKHAGRAPRLTKYGYYRTEVARVGRWLESHGFKGKAKTKRVPSRVFRWPLRLRRAFIRGFVDADGCIDKKKRAQVRSAGFGLIHDVRHLAMAAGFVATNITSQTRVYQPPCSPRPIEATSYHVGFSATRLAPESVRFARVRSVALVGHEDVYDLTVEGSHNFIADGMVVHNTRWHSRDLFAKLIDGGGWREIRLPALAEENDPLGRRPGESLWEQRHPKAKLLALRDGPKGDGRGAMPPRIWSALYQGRPIGESGGIFQLPWLSHEVDVRPSLVSGRVRYWDPAASKRQRAGDPDWAVGTLMSKIRTGALDGAYCVEEIDRFRGSALEVERRIIAAAVRDGKRVPIRIEQEPGSEAVLYIAYLQRLLAGWDVKGVVHGTDKATRARPFASQCEVGNVVFVRGPWLVQAREELCGFVGDGSEDHDDVPDSMTGAFEALAGAVRWPWMSAAAAGRDRRDRAPRDEIGFDRGEFDRALESCASSAATQFGGGDL